MGRRGSNPRWGARGTRLSHHRRDPNDRRAAGVAAGHRRCRRRGGGPRHQWRSNPQRRSSDGRWSDRRHGVRARQDATGPADGRVRPRAARTPATGRARPGPGPSWSPRVPGAAPAEPCTRLSKPAAAEPCTRLSKHGRCACQPPAIFERGPRRAGSFDNQPIRSSRHTQPTYVPGSPSPPVDRGAPASSETSAPANSHPGRIRTIRVGPPIRKPAATGRGPVLESGTASSAGGATGHSQLDG